MPDRTTPGTASPSSGPRSPSKWKASSSDRAEETDSLRPLADLYDALETVTPDTPQPIPKP